MTDRARRWLIPALAAGTEALGAVVALLQAPTSNVYMETRLWIVFLTTGLVVAAGLLGWRLLRRRVASARAEGAAEAVRTAGEDHRRFLLRLDHELKNPLTAIQAGLANLDGRADAGPDGSTVASITSQTQRLANLVSDLRKLAELETRPIERQPVDLTELLDEVHDAVGELLDDGSRTLTLTLPRAPWPLGTVPGDRDLLFLALHNLVVNAVKFTKAGDTIELRARDDGEQVVVEVADTGIGIPDDEVAYIWEELARGSAATGTPGMGLGLAMVRVVVARHGGTVSVRSREGYGTVIGVELPTA